MLCLYSLFPLPSFFFRFLFRFLFPFRFRFPLLFSPFSVSVSVQLCFPVGLPYLVLCRFSEPASQVPPLTPGTNKKIADALMASFENWNKEQEKRNIPKGRLELQEQGELEDLRQET